MKTEQQLKALCSFFESFEGRMYQQGRLMIALHARGQFDKYNRLLASKR
ncbi:hypothetical protein PAECIP112173_00374 [Paenibacillus sp. JJ-100]|nr:hypothetical protein [Paenibacillus sp. JJ-100]CAI6024218.1 hypothetical protein PAECIP112173_00374 [Paenibacillus sp. JJ-100]